MTLELLIIIVVIATILFIGWWLPQRKKGKPVPDQLISLLSLSANHQYLLFFWGKYCHHCKVMMPVIEDLQKSHSNLKLIMVDDHPELTRKMGILGVPSLVVVTDNKVVDYKVGAKTKSQIESLLTTIQ